jgi:hypothetical protein
MHRRAIVLGLVLAGCRAPESHRPIDMPPPTAPTADATRETKSTSMVSESTRLDADSPVLRGELPWWHDVHDGIYRYKDEIVVIALGDSLDHHHIQEGFLHAKVAARLAVRKASEQIRFKDGIPEPTLEDLFITRERRFFALYMIRVPKDAELTVPVPELAPPDLFKASGRRRVGRHIFEKDRHLFLECDVEGPVANPDWGRTRAAARG